MNIGIIGEDPYDTTAIINLLKQRYPLRFKPILKNIKGDQLYSAKTKRLFKIELENQSFSVIIFTKDLDGLESETKKKERILKWFQQLNALTDDTGVMLLHIYELEALILADIQTFNTIFHTKINFSGNPMYRERPKEYLMEQTRKSRKRFVVSENPGIFKSLRLDKVIQNCSYFKAFIDSFEKKTNRG